MVILITMFFTQDIDGEGNIWVTDVGLHQVNDRNGTGYYKWY